MGWRHTKAVWADSEPKGAARLVLLCLADHANEADMAWPSISTIVNETQVSDRQVQRAIGWLAEKGKLVIVEQGNGRGNSTLYRVTLPLKGDTVSPNNQPGKGDTVSVKGDMVSERVTFETEKGDTMSPEVLREIPIERTEKKEGEAPKPPADNPFPFRPSPTKPAVTSPAQEKVNALIAICGLDPDIPDHVRQAENTAAQLGKKYTADYLRKRYAYQEQPNGTWYWYRDDWRGKRPERPTLKAVLETVAIELVPATGAKHATRQGNNRKDYPEYQPVTQADIEWWQSVNGAGAGTDTT